MFFESYSGQTGFIWSDRIHLVRQDSAGWSDRIHLVRQDSAGWSDRIHLVRQDSAEATMCATNSLMKQREGMGGRMRQKH